MTQQKAKVTRLLGDNRAEVAVRRQSACGHDCSRCGGGCSELMVEPEIRVIARNIVGAAAGDMVTLESDTAPVLGAAVVVYLVPFLLFFAGYFTVSLGFKAGEGLCIAAGGVGFLLGGVLAWLLDRHRRKDGEIQFRIVAVERSS